MKAKSFAVGVRMEHPQELIDRNQYGRPHGKSLPAADYKVTRKLENGKGVYSFCMCPGGYVVNASSEQQMLAVNGMSYHSRAGQNANSAMVVTVGPRISAPMRSWREWSFRGSWSGPPMKPGKERFRCSFSVIS